MAIFKQACTWEVTDKLLVVKENKCKCVFSNPNQHLLTKIKVDGCQITDGIRCDYHTIKKKAIIVSSRNPSNDTSVQRAKAMFKKKYGVELIPKNIQIEITIK